MKNDLNLAVGKKRYSIVLTQARYERFQRLCKQIGAPRGTEAQSIDDFVASISATLEQLIAAKSGQGREPAFSDIMLAVSKGLREIEDGQADLKL